MLSDYIMASAYLPFFRTRKLAGGMTFLDGGLYNNSPVNMLLERGSKHIIDIKPGEHIGIEKRVDKSSAEIFEVLPSEDLGSLIDVDQNKIKYNIRLGYFDTMRLLEDLAGSRYYLKSSHRERYYLLKLSKIRPMTSGKLEVLTRRSGPRSYRHFFEEGAVYLARRLKLGKDWRYDTLAIAMMEYMAEAIGIERLVIYDESEFLQKLKEEIPAYFGYSGYSKDSIQLEHVIGEMLMNF